MKTKIESTLEPTNRVPRNITELSTIEEIQDLPLLPEKVSFFEKNKNLILLSVAVVAGFLLYKKFGK